MDKKEFVEKNRTALGEWLVRELDEARSLRWFWENTRQDDCLWDLLEAAGGDPPGRDASLRMMAQAYGRLLDRTPEPGVLAEAPSCVSCFLRGGRDAAAGRLRGVLEQAGGRGGDRGRGCLREMAETLLEVMTSGECGIAEELRACLDCLWWSSDDHAEEDSEWLCGLLRSHVPCPFKDGRQ